VKLPHLNLRERSSDEETEMPTARYEIRVRGHLDEAIATGLRPHFSTEVSPAETVLHGEGVDQSALHGVLDQLERLGIELLEVRRLPDGDLE
jgi:hypothetical protein